MPIRHSQPWWIWIAIVLDGPIAFLLHLADSVYSFDLVGDFIFKHLPARVNPRALRLLTAAAITLIPGAWLASASNGQSSLANWLIVIGAIYFVFAVVVASHVHRSRKPSPEPRPLCSKCQYDLTGNVSGVCPECGTAIDRLIPPLNLLGK